MIDIHCHILPGLDDGPKDLDQSREMLRVAAGDGVRTIVGTPHFGGVFGEADPDEIRRLTARVNEVAREEGIRVEVLPGCEALLTPELPEQLQRGEVLTLGDAGKYILVEVHPEPIPKYGLDVIFRLRVAQVTPILAHGERLCFTAEGKRLVRELVTQGGLVQMNADAAGGSLGWRVRRLCTWMRREGLAHTIASDGHSPTHRPPLLTPCLKGFGRREREGALAQYCSLDLRA